MVRRPLFPILAGRNAAGSLDHAAQVGGAAISHLAGDAFQFQIRLAEQARGFIEAEACNFLIEVMAEFGLH
jgi:hypothetical protein